MYNKIITLIGSRSTPKEIIDLMDAFVLEANKHGYIFRSGGAYGADHVVTRLAKNKEIYIPWDNFNEIKDGIVPMFTAKHREIIKEIHPAYYKLSHGAILLHMRNINQIYGMDVLSPVLSDLVVCWTENGLEKGGTATAIRLAKKHNIKIINLGETSSISELKTMIQTLKLT